MCRFNAQGSRVQKLETQQKNQGKIMAIKWKVTNSRRLTSHTISETTKIHKT